MDESGPTGSGVERLTDEQPRSVGRYEIRGVLGRGAISIVYAAYDPKFDRDVALKLIGSRFRDEASNVRLQLEVRTLAKLAEHPNVVIIHDVGETEDALFVATDLVRGGTLREWLRAEQRDWHEILAMFIAAGRGLAAAHELGLVHRDFTPSNVLIDEDGRPRVVDFGLARAADDLQDTFSGDVDSEDGMSTARARENQIELGMIMGTPSYMSPEQFMSSAPDARSDQFSFCVALWEALYGERPFAGTTIPMLARAVTRGEVQLGPSRGVPKPIRGALLRGLDADRTRRWPNLAELLDTLERVPRRRTTGIAAIVVAVVLGLVGLIWALFG